MMLDCNGGRENKKLWRWYEDQGFVGVKDSKYPRLMYFSHKKILDR
jgi:hypothetical protein